MNTDTIGANAGQLWEALSTAEALGIKQIKKITKLKKKKSLQLSVGSHAKAR